MEHFEYIKDVVETPSYLKQLACKQSNILLIYVTPLNYSEIAKFSPRVSNAVSTSNDTASEKSSCSGNPLEIDLEDDDDYVFVSLSPKMEYAHLWRRNEETQFPLPLYEATKFLQKYSQCQETGDSINHEAVYCICDGRNNQNIVILGGVHTTEHVMRTTVSVRCCWAGRIEDVHIDNLKNEHLEQICRRYKQLLPVSSETTWVFQVYGFPLAEYKPSMIYPYNGSVSLEVVSRGAMYSVTEEESITKAKIQSIFGHKDSKLRRFWQKLVLLQGLTNALKRMRDPRFKGAHDTLQFSSIHKPDDEIVCSVIDVVNTAVRPKIKILPGQYGDIASVVENFEAIFERDMYTKMFEVLKYCKNAGELVNCFQIAMEEVLINRNTIRIPNRNYSRVGTIFYRITSGELRQVPRMLPADAVEFLLEIGLNQLLDDYSNILVYVNYLTEEDISKLRDVIGTIQTRYYYEREDNCRCTQDRIRYDPATGQVRIRTKAYARKPCPCSRNFPCVPGNLGVSKPLENYQAKMCALGRLHVVLDLSQLAETNCDLPGSMLPSVVRRIFKHFIHSETEITSFESLAVEPLRTFTATFPTWNAFKLKLMKPTIWRLCMASMKGRETVDTVFHYSLLPIFPPSVFKDYRLPGEAANGEFYYVTKMVNRFYPL